MNERLNILVLNAKCIKYKNKKEKEKLFLNLQKISNQVEEMGIDKMIMIILSDDTCDFRDKFIRDLEKSKIAITIDRNEDLLFYSHPNDIDKQDHKISFNHFNKFSKHINDIGIYNNIRKLYYITADINEKASVEGIFAAYGWKESKCEVVQSIGIDNFAIMTSILINKMKRSEINESKRANQKRYDFCYER